MIIALTLLFFFALAASISPVTPNIIILNQPSLYLTTCSRTHPLQCRDIKTAEAFEASNAAVAVEYYTKARDLIAPLLGGAYHRRSVTCRTRYRWTSYCAVPDYLQLL